MDIRCRVRKIAALWKTEYGDVTLDQVSNYLGILFGLNALENTQLRRDVPGSGDQTDIASPTILRMFTIGTFAKMWDFLLIPLPCLPSRVIWNWAGHLHRE